MMDLKVMMRHLKVMSDVSKAFLIPKLSRFMFPGIMILVGKEVIQ